MQFLRKEKKRGMWGVGGVNGPVTLPDPSVGLLKRRKKDFHRRYNYGKNNTRENLDRGNSSATK